MKKLRLLISPTCNRNCPLCANKGFDLAALPIARDFSTYEEVILTGGEPLLPENILMLGHAINQIRDQSEAKVYVHTAKYDLFIPFAIAYEAADGMTVTIHTQQDVPVFKRVVNDLLPPRGEPKSMRLKVFKGINIDSIRASLTAYPWDVRENEEWKENCPLPPDEDFMRVPDEWNQLDEG